MYGYLYDASGTRVAKGSLTTFSCDASANGFTVMSAYAIGPTGEEVSEVNGVGALIHTNVSGGGMLLATYQDNGLHFQLTDWLGTKRAQTDYQGKLEEICPSLPFGDGLNCQLVPSASEASERHFTGKERDAESGLDYFGARYSASTMGRWMSPDRVNVTEDRMMNPSSTLNKYAYGANNPLKYLDPDGDDITVFYEPANLPAGSPGHTMLLAYDQSNGGAAVKSFGPDYTNGATVIGTLGGTPGTDSFDFNTFKSPSDIRAAFSSITIRTTPEEAEAVIAQIKAHPDGDYKILARNCTTVCSKILRQLNKTRSHALTPAGFFGDLCNQYGCNRPVGSNGHDVDVRGMKFGNPRDGYDPFSIIFNAIPKGNPEGQPQQNNSAPCLKRRDTGDCV